ncbi:ATP-binding protein [Proteiniclasticum sp. BAD-10]|uniref:ATP-binding protein n=1 Tax=Proteiniclasticum sediminis TaxID=2804028 RepID=A0A941CPQ7_9CLOT|nr:ATP-binding protein [Proteiniclasticum sediminis]
MSAMGLRASTLRETASRDLLEIIEAREEGCSTIFCSQYAKGGSMDGTISDAILDRVIHNSYTW